MKHKNDSKKEKPSMKLLTKPLKGSFLALVFTIVIILILALIAKSSGMGDKTISVLNQIIKVAGIIFAAYIGCKGIEKKQYIAGGFSGVLYIIMCFLLFSLLEGKMGNGALLFSDLLMSVVIGIIGAVVFSKVPKMKKSKAALNA
jgi:putative membrane protein (TIGR04086 family)